MGKWEELSHLMGEVSDVNVSTMLNQLTAKKNKNKWTF